MRQTIEFFEDSLGASSSRTKFGGQPDWLATPQWPLSKSTGQQMRFLCQIELDERLFPASTGQMAFIFITDGDEYVDGTWEPDGGENCVVIQPSDAPLPVSVTNHPTGPTLYTMREVAGNALLTPFDQTYGVTLTLATDPGFQPAHVRQGWSKEQFDAYASRLEGNKIGGTPIFLQNDEFPSDESWRLLLQLDATQVPFSVNFGDAGVAYAFIDMAGSKGRLLWQCG